MQKGFKQDYLHYTRKEKTGTIVLLLTIGCMLFIPFIYRHFYSNAPVDESNLKDNLARLDSMKTDKPPAYAEDENISEYYRKPTAREHETPASTLFYFDPNKLDENGWMKLGVREKTAGNILKYISKGGKFREPNDIRKIWGISPGLIEKLIPYARIPKEPENTYHSSFTSNRYESSINPKREPRIVDINDADSAAYTELPGIGPSFAGRIVRFRNRLGGFYALSQVGETFGLPDSVFKKIGPFLKLNSSAVHMINLNTADEGTLKSHPYIRWQLAGVIIQYRNQHGNFESVDDLRKIMIITNDVFKKIAPYLKVKD